MSTTATFVVLGETESCILGTLSGVFRCLHKGQEKAVKAVTIYKPGFNHKEDVAKPVPDALQRAWIIHVDSRPLAIAESRDAATNYLSTSAAGHV